MVANSTVVNEFFRPLMILLVTLCMQGCSIQTVATSYELNFLDASRSLPPGCLALFLTDANGDAIVQSIILTDTVNRACLNSATFPLAETKLEGDWLTSFDAITSTTVRYRLLNKIKTCVYLIEVQKNFGGSFTADQILLLETGRRINDISSTSVILSLVQSFEPSQVPEASQRASDFGSRRLCS